jgi:Zn-dependent protease
MFGWSINLFRIRGIRISLDVTFLALLAYFGYNGWKAYGMPGLWWSAATLCAFFACVVFHELGHSLTAMRFGVHVRRILLTVIGGVAQFDRIPRRPSQELLITIAGPAVNFAIAGVLWLLIGFPEGPDVGSIPLSPLDLGHTLLVWNIWVGLFNLIPAFPMDGGRILRALLAMRLPYLKATFWAATVGKMITVPGALLAFYYGDYFIGLICLFIFPAGEAEYRSVKRQEAEEAHWRESLHPPVVTPPPDEPPILNL